MMLVVKFITQNVTDMAELCLDGTVFALALSLT